MPFKCKFCGNLFDTYHRLPENHNCPGLEKWKERHQEELKEGKASVVYEPTSPNEPKSLEHDYNKSEHQLQHKPFHHKIFRISLRLPKSFRGYSIIFIVLFLVFGIIFSFVKIPILETLSWIFLYIVEILGIIALIKRIDRIHISSDLSTWGLKVLAFVFILIGVYIFFFGAAALSVVYSLYVFWFFGVIAFGLWTIAAFLMFKFKRRSGLIVWHGA